MSISKSQDNMSNLTKSSIQNNQKQAPSTLTFPSNSVSTNDKENLIDEYQEKMGDMLDCQKELCTVKTQLSKVIDQSKQSKLQFTQLLQEKDIKLEEANRRIQELQNENDSRIQSEISCNSKVTKYETKCKHYKDIINQLKQELQKKENQNQNQKNEHKENEKKSKNQIIEIQKQLETKNSQISDLKVQLTELKQQGLSTSESFSNQQKQIEGLLKDKEEFESQISKLSDSKEKLKSDLKQSNDEIVVLQATISDQQNSIMKLRKDKIKYKQNCSDLMKTVEDLKSQLKQYSEYTQKIQELEGQLSKIQKLYQKETKKTNNATNLLSMITSFVGEAYKPKDILSNVRKVCQERDELRQKINKDNQTDNNYKEIKEQNDNLKSKLANLEKRNSMQKLRDVVCSSIENARKEKSEQLLKLARNFGYEKSDITFRSVIITVLLSSRLNKIIKEPPEDIVYVKDNRNWFWISKDDDSKMNNIIIDSAKLLHEYQNEQEQAKKTNEQINDEMNKLESEIKNKKQKLDEREKSLVFLRQEIYRLNEELSSLIDPETYSELNQNFVVLKKQFKALKQNEQKLQDENHQLSEQLEEMTIHCQDQENEINALQEEIEVIKVKNEKLIEDIKILEKSQLAKNKELLSLERGIQKAKTTNDRNTAQCQVLALENQNLFNQIHHSKVINVQDINIQANQVGLKATRTLL
ncbi:hypothetical protein M9Y10_011949 [Tritrichomonas musculus]|uniref:GRIP domain-containing protein n=1 Tax=Tritrichomonas musculus TaxID=1915356 RepID=A0ABR2ICK0_9EUKA